jgi:hypothetical protein
VLSPGSPMMSVGVDELVETAEYPAALVQLETQL